jgi:pectin methylesterase-like acyl-CoA thioesterase
MNPQIVSQTGIGSSPLQALARDIAPFAVSFGCVITGTVTFSIEYTYDDPNTGPSGVIGAWPAQTKTPTWWPFTALATKSANTDACMGTPTLGPVFGWRVTVSAGTGTVTVTATQAGIQSGGG